MQEENFISVEDVRELVYIYGSFACCLVLLFTAIVGTDLQ
jgi:hypothetical protein